MNRKTASFVVFAWILAFCLMVSLPLRAQVTGATISGTITDASGGVIVGAQVSVRNTATAIIRNTTADSAGFYTVPNLIPGPYEVKITAMGFTTSLQSNLTLAVGAQQSLNIPMKVGETSQTVQVTEAAPQIELTSSTLSGQVESQPVLELPLNGRDWASLATLSPGVNALETQMPFESGAVRGNRGFGAQLTISGGRPTQNNHRRAGQRDRRQPGRGCDSGILRAHRQLLGRVWEDLRRRGQRHQQVGDERVPWRLIRVPA